MKRNNGITLIALIITIVVLLILAGVAIGTLQESNIIGRAKDAVSSYEESKNEEEGFLKDYEIMLGGLQKKERVYGTENFFIVLTLDNKIVGYENGIWAGEYVISSITNKLGDFSLSSDSTVTPSQYIFINMEEMNVPMAALSEDGQTLYMGSPDIDDMEVTFSDSSVLELNPKIVKHSKNVECYPGVAYGENLIIYVIDYDANTMTNFQTTDGGATYTQYGSQGPIDITVTSNEMPYDITVGSDTVTIGTNAKLISGTDNYNDFDFIYVVQDEKLYMGETEIVAGVTIESSAVVNNMQYFDLTKLGYSE